MVEIHGDDGTGRGLTRFRKRLAHPNRKQRLVILVMALTLIGLLVYRPWWWNATRAEIVCCPGRVDSYFREGTKRDWFFNAPKPPYNADKFHSGVVVLQWLTEMAFVVIAGSGLLWVLKED